VDSFAAPNEAPVRTLIPSTMRKAREPGEWDGDRAAIHQVYCQSIIVYVNALANASLSSVSEVRIPDTRSRLKHLPHRYLFSQSSTSFIW
jgi:hypothetical protein